MRCPACEAQLPHIAYGFDRCDSCGAAFMFEQGHTYGGNTLRAVGVEVQAPPRPRPTLIERLAAMSDDQEPWQR